MLKIKTYRNGKCFMTGKDGPGVDIELDDGSLKQFVSFKALEKLLKARVDDARQMTLPGAPRNPITPP